MVKIVGFKKVNGRVCGYRTPSGLVRSGIFRDKCKVAADKLGIGFEELCTKRQASKFLAGRGIVFKVINEF